MIDSFAKYR